MGLNRKRCIVILVIILQLLFAVYLLFGNKEFSSGNITVETGRPAEPKKTGRPAEPKKTGRPPEPKKTGRPVESEKTGRPVESEKTGRPVESEKTGRPVESEKTGRPAEPKKTGKPVESEKTGRPGVQKPTEETGESSKEHNALKFVSQDTLSVWDKRDFLVVFGIPSLDIPGRKWRRHMQRMTCWQFAEVATRENNYTGAMLVLYLLAKHPMHNYVISRDVVKEAEQWQDIVLHPMNEGVSDTDKILNGRGFWGFVAEIGSSRKTFCWYSFALRQFPRAPYFAKGDDDMFLRVPQYLTDLRRLPKQGIYWGGYLVSDAMRHKFGFRKGVPFMTGYCFTLARDVVGALVSYEPLRKLVWTPFTRELEEKFLIMNMDHEDVMVAWGLQQSGYPTIFVAEGRERFHRYSSDPPTKNVLVTHIPREHEYYSLFSQFLITPTSKPTVITQKTPTFYTITLQE